METAGLLLWLSLQACDIGTTHVALASGRFHEANPIVGTSSTISRIYAVKFTINAAALTTWTKTRRRHKYAVVLPITMIAGGTIGCSINTWRLRH